MSDRTVDIEDLADAINEVVEEYKEEVLNKLNKITKQTGRELKELVKEGAPVDTGKYKKAIRVTHRENRMSAFSSVVHVRGSRYRLAHLLEKPHALRNGGLSKPKPHFRPALTKIEPKYINAIRDELEKGG